MIWLAWILAFSGQNGVKTEPLDTAPVVQFGFERPVAGVSYRFVLREDGSGTYRATYQATPPAIPGETVEVPLRVHAGTAKKIFEQARSTVPLHGNCETKAKGIAQTGIKSLTYIQEAGAPGSMCAWNYSEKVAVRGLQDEFQAMASTLDEGRKLQMEQRFDRLGMDREMGLLVDEVKDGRAQGLENIAPVLQGIVDDVSLLERVRTRAKMLLDLSMVER